MWVCSQKPGKPIPLEQELAASLDTGVKFFPRSIRFLEIPSCASTGRDNPSLAHRAAIPADNDQVVLMEVR